MDSKGKNKSANSGLMKRINELIPTTWGGKSEFCRKVGIHASNLQHWVRGDTVPSDTVLWVIAQKFGVRAEWLRDGEEPKWSGTISLPDGPVKVPVISFAQAGRIGMESVNPFDCYEPGDAPEILDWYGQTGPRSFAVRVVGDSMSPYYLPDDLIVVDPECEVCNRDHVIAKFDTGEVLIKMLLRSDRGDFLQSINPDFKEIRVDEHCQIIGVVQGSMRFRRYKGR